MGLSVIKCKSMRLSRRKPTCSTYYLDFVYKYIGVHITSHLSGRLHIEHVINSANRMLGFRFGILAPFFHKTLMRPKLEYAASVMETSA